MTRRPFLQRPIQALQAQRNPTYDPDAPYVPARQLQLGRGLRTRVRRAPIHVQRTRLPRAVRAGGAEARLHRRLGRRGRGRGPDQPRRQRRGDRARVGARRARQRLLAGPRRSLGSLARPLAAPIDLPRRLARPARQGGRARHPLRLRTRTRSSTSSPTAAASRFSSRPSRAGTASPTSGAEHSHRCAPGVLHAPSPRGLPYPPSRSPTRCSGRAAPGCRAAASEP